MRRVVDSPAPTMSPDDASKGKTDEKLIEKVKALREIDLKTLSTAELAAIGTLQILVPIFGGLSAKVLVPRQLFITAVGLILGATRILLPDLKAKTVFSLSWIAAVTAITSSQLAGPPRSAILSDNLIILGTSAVLWTRFKIPLPLMRLQLFIQAVLTSLQLFFTILSRIQANNGTIGLILVGLSATGLLYWVVASVRGEDAARAASATAAIEREAEMLVAELGRTSGELTARFGGGGAVETTLTASKAETIVKKLKLLKHSLLLEQGKSAQAKLLAKERLAEDTLSVSSRSSSRRYSVRAQVLAREVEHRDANWALTAADADQLLNGMLAKGQALWQPAFDREPLAAETRAFLRENFSEGRRWEAPKTGQPFKRMASLTEFNPMNEYLKIICLDWNFDVFKLRKLSKTRTFSEFGAAIFEKFAVGTTLRASPDVAAQFLTTLGKCYMEHNPFHNPLHPIDVTQCVGYFLVKGLEAHLSGLEVAALLIGSLAHDVAHPGLNNAFMLNSKSRLAYVYNDTGVLENFHASCLFQILETPATNILSALEEREWRYFRKVSTTVILDTFQGRHFALTSKFKNALAVGELDMKEEPNRLLAMSMAVKCGDIAHGAKELGLHKRWFRRAVEEFWRQGDEERRRGLPVSPGCDREVKTIARAQEAFIKAIVSPIFESWAEFFKNEGDVIKKNCLENVRKNLEYWADQAQKEQNGTQDFLQDTAFVLDELAEEALLEEQSLFSAL
eukprot:TRINITY_DN2634_c0_g2_i1.p1 TRINITY_DN2634_c0_g2~~TRINITY_DN2634_c0_g2_i1.p1  ORF type:complete len:737 (+),score=210.26 TRINITY_DN2634_c0_g2_i1:157-2367(+)